MTEKKSLKHRGEDAASAYLERLGICVVERNWRCSADTIDIIAWDSDTLVVVNVKTRKSCHQEKSGAVSTAVARRIKRLVEAYVEHAGLESVAWRYDRIDLLVISNDRALLRHHRNALDTT